jgi:hypothetical protein
MSLPPVVPVSTSTPNDRPVAVTDARDPAFASS